MILLGDHMRLSMHFALRATHPDFESLRFISYVLRYTISVTTFVMCIIIIVPFFSGPGEILNVKRPYGCTTHITIPSAFLCKFEPPFQLLLYFQLWW